MRNEEPAPIDRPPPAAPRSPHTGARKAAGASFPLRVGAIDVGSNAIRFFAAEFAGPDRFAVVEQARVPVRLGHSVFETGRLSEQAMDAAAAALAAFRARMAALGLVAYRAVATSAVRESANGAAFLARLHEEADLVLEPITAAEEARLVHRAVRSRLDLGAGDWLLVDVGGGSVELSSAGARGIRRTISHPLGAVRLLEDLAADAGDGRRLRRRVEERVAAIALPVEGTPRGFVATGGNSEVLAAMTKSARDERGVSRIPLERLRALVDELVVLTPAERARRYRLRADRADVILPGAVVYERLCTQAGSGEVLVPHVGVREGLVLDLADELAGSGR